jgi:hypothetical protein
MLRSRYGYVPGQFADFVDWLDAGGRVMLAQAEAVRAAAATIAPEWISPTRYISRKPMANLS